MIDSVATSKPFEAYRRSVMMIIIGGACLSLLGIGMRIMDSASSLQIIFFRSATQAIFLSVVLLVINRRQPLKPFLTLGKHGLLAAAMFGGAGLFMILAVNHTSVANAVFIVSLAPLSSAMLGKLLLDEQVTKRTWQAIFIAVIGIAIIFGAGISGGGLLGMGFAFIMMLLYSGSLIVIRSQKGADMIAVGALSGAFLAIAVLPFLESFTITLHDYIICAALGVFQIGLGQILITKGAAHVPTAQVSLLALLEVVLSPIWVWLAVNETPSVYSLVGGCIVLIGVVMQALSRGKTN